MTRRPPFGRGHMCVCVDVCVCVPQTVVCVSLSLDDYQAALARMEGQTFESLKFIHLMLMSKAKRTPKELQSLAGEHRMSV